MIYFTRYHADKSVTMLNLYYDGLIGKIEEYEGKNFLMVNNYTLDKLLDKIKIMGIEKLDDIRILIDTDNELLYGVTLKNVCDINDMCYQRWW